MADNEVGKVLYRVGLDNSGMDRDIQSTESTLSQKLDRVSGTLNKQFGYTILKDVGTAFIAAGKAAYGFGAEAVRVGSDFDKSMSQVAATMGKTTDEIADLRKFAQDMGATTAFSATQAAEALNYMALAGYDADEAMAMMPNVLNLASAGNMELARASDMVTDASSALGLEMDETAAMVDQMAQAASKSNTSVAQLGDAILAVGGTAKSLAGGTVELSTALGIMADSGIKGAEAGTHMRNILLALSPQTDAAAGAMDELGFSAYDSEGKLRPLNESFAQLAASLDGMSDEARQNILSDIFNKTDLAAVDAMLSAAAYDIGKIDEAVFALNLDWTQAQTIFDGWGESTETGIQSVISLVQEWTLAGQDQEETLHYLRDIIGLTQEDAESLIQTVNNQMDEQGNRWTELTGYIDEASGAAKKMADTQLDNLAGSMTLFKSALEGVQIAISDSLSPTLKEFVDLGTEGLSGVATALSAGDWDGAVSVVADFAQQALEKITDMLPQMLEAGVQILGSLVEGLLQSLPDLIGAAIEIILTLVDGLGDQADQIIDAAVQILVVLAEGLIEALPKLVDAAVKIIAALGKYLLDHGPELVEKGGELVGKLIGGLIQSIPKLTAGAIQLINSIKDSFGRINWGQVGINVIRGIANGISGAVGFIADAARNAAQNAFNAAKSFLGINSPSTLFRDKIGAMIPEGMALGIDDGADEVSKSMLSLGDSVVRDFDVNYRLPDFSGLISDIGATFTGSASQEIIVPVQINGREVARETAWFMNEQLAWEER